MPYWKNISFSPEDVRVTTRVDEKNFGNMLWSCIHEGGHALYEQGIPTEAYGSPIGNAVSLAIHESQSRATKLKKDWSKTPSIPPN